MSYRRYPQPTPWWVYALVAILVIVVVVALTRAN